VQTHLIRRSGSAMYYFRRRVPADLREHFNGRAELTKSLGTSERREAERLARAMAVRYDDEFQALRNARNGAANKLAQPQEQQQDSPPPENKRQIPDAGAQLSAVGDVQSTAARILVRLRAQREKAVAEDKLEEFLRDQRSSLEWDKHALEGKADPFLPAWQHEAFVIARQHLLEPGRYPALPLPAKTQQTAPTQAVEPALSATESVSLEKLAELWQKDRNPTNARTILKANLVVRKFIEQQGDLPVHTVTRRHCIAFRDELRASGQSIPNTNGYTDKLRALFSVAQARDLIKENPATGLAIKDPTPKSQKRLPFDTAALVRVFSCPVYTAGERPKGGAGEAAYWLPLLALFTGARLEELGQLTPEDVREESYDDGTGNRVTAWVIRLTDAGEGQGVKNASSVRRVPLHAELIRLGFVAFAQARQGKPRIFFELRPDTKGVETGLWSKWFGRWLRGTCKVADERIVFHSFRHTFKDLCRDAEIAEDVHDALTGHSGANSIGRSYGSDKYRLRPLVLAMQRFRLPAQVQKAINALPQHAA
jgi:integrase